MYNSTRWSEDFYQKLCKEFGEYQGGVNFKLFDPIFPVDYVKVDAEMESSMIDATIVRVHACSSGYIQR